MLEKTCKWKKKHDAQAQESANTAEIVECLGRTEEASKKARAERDASIKANDEMGCEIFRKETEIKKAWIELTKTQTFVTDYLMKEVHKAPKAKEVENSQKAHGKYTVEINSLNRQLKHAQKEDATQFEQLLWKIRQELNDGERKWS